MELLYNMLSHSVMYWRSKQVLETIIAVIKLHGSILLPLKSTSVSQLISQLKGSGLITILRNRMCVLQTSFWIVIKTHCPGCWSQSNVTEPRNKQSASLRWPKLISALHPAHQEVVMTRAVYWHHQGIFQSLEQEAEGVWRKASDAVPHAFKNMP